MGVEGVDVGQEGAHLSGHPRAQVLGRKAVKVPAKEDVGAVWAWHNNKAIKALTSWPGRYSRCRI